ncbi:hypothetical protein B0H13DRAFT_2664027 [Mycena leptocephala]|nr:hypothetical protein B0H13DRAFT_2664027 [Mycena leptocephala]
MLGALATDRACVADLEARILDLEHSISALRIEKALLQERLDSYKYPILTLPTEIVSEIFTHFLPIYPLCPPLTGVLSPTLLTQICRQWRDIALETPVLWRGILFSQNITPSDVSHMLDRSRCSPLSIRMDAYSEGVQLSEFFATVVPHCARWEYLKLRLLQTTFPPIEGAMPLLRHLDFAVQTLEDGSDPNPFFIAPCELPLLRTVILNDVAALSVTLPWVQLASLTLTRVYIQECVPILLQTSNLVYCALELYSDNNDSQPNITLPYLKSLTLIAPKRTSLPRMNDLQIFIVPALLSLKIPERFLGLDPIDSLTSFVSKSGCTLQEVCIAGKRLFSKSSYHSAFPLIQTFLFSGRSANDEEGPGLP